MLFILSFILIPCVQCQKQGDLYQDPERKLNVIIIISDALRYDALGCYGGEARTPNIDWLAENGTLFQKAYAASPWTAPSAVSMITGFYAGVFENGIRVYNRNNKKPSFHVPDTFITLPGLLKNLQYDVAIQINNANGVISNNMKDFSRFGKYSSLAKKEKSEIERISGIKAANFQYKSMYTALNYFLKKSDGRPYFTVIWITDPHAPYNPIDRYRNRIQVNASDLSMDPVDYSQKKNFNQWEYKKPGRHDIDYIKKLYLAEVESVDERVGYIIKILMGKDSMKDTVIIFSSDHGEAFGRHGLFTHGSSYYEELMHIPLIFFGAHIPKNYRIHTPVSNLDLMPTLKEMLGVTYQDHFQGKSYFPLFSRAVIDRKPLYFDAISRYNIRKPTQKFVDALLADGFKLITRDRNTPLLYDLSADPEERKNIAEENPEIVDKLHKQILAKRKANKKLRGKYTRNSIDKIFHVSKKHKREIIDNLKSLGYIE